MARGRSQVVGGPHDGLLTEWTRGAYVWIDGDGRGWLRAGVGRCLYFWDDGAWRYAGEQARECGSCGAILGVDGDTGQGCATCPLCGA